MWPSKRLSSDHRSRRSVPGVRGTLLASETLSRRSCAVAGLSSVCDIPPHKEHTAMATRYAVGVDVGGTKIYAGVVNIETGEVIGTARKRTHPERGADFFVDRLLSVISSAIDDSPRAQK